MTTAATIANALRPLAPGGKLASDDVPLIDKLAALWDARGIPADAFDRWLPHILKHEGGYVNHPRDPGGATMKGITQKTYDSWRDRQRQPRQSVRLISDAEISAIYRRDYWEPIRGDELPAGVDYCVFDFAVNSGINRAARYLQNAVGTEADGVIGAETIAAAGSVGPASIINHICDARMSFLKGLSTWRDFGKGWTARVSDVRAKALEAAK